MLKNNDASSPLQVRVNIEGSAYLDAKENQGKDEDRCSQCIHIFISETIAN